MRSEAGGDLRPRGLLLPSLYVRGFASGEVADLGAKTQTQISDHAPPVTRKSLGPPTGLKILAMGLLTHPTRGVLLAALAAHQVRSFSGVWVNGPMGFRA